jgi:hypothetical protein
MLSSKNSDSWNFGKAAAKRGLEVLNPKKEKPPPLSAMGFYSYGVLLRAPGAAELLVLVLLARF